MDSKRKGLIAALVLGLLSGPAMALGISGSTGGDTAEASAPAAPTAVVLAVRRPRRDPLHPGPAARPAVSHPGR